MNQRIWLVALLLAMVAMQVGLALRHSLWADELFSLAMATGHSLEHPPALAEPERGDYVEAAGAVTGVELRRYTKFATPAAGSRDVLRAVYLSDTSPPLYYLVLNAWSRVFGVGDLSLRMLSIGFSLACVPLIYAIGREMAGDRAGKIAAVLFAIAPLSLYYSAEGRMYSMLWFCVLAVAWATIRLYQGNGDRRAAIVWVAGSAAGLLVHYYFVFPWGASLLFLVVCRGEDRWRRLALRTGVVLLLILPWYWRLPQNLAQWRITQDWVNLEPAGYQRLGALRDILLKLFSGNGHYLWDAHRIAEAGAIAIFAVALGFAAWRFRTKMFSGVTLFVILWFAVACLGPLVADIVRGTYIAAYARYTSTALPAVCLLGAWALANVSPRVALLAVSGIALCWAPSVASIYKSRSRCGQAMRDVVRYVGAQQPEDLVVVHSIPSGAILLARYISEPVSFAVWTGQLNQRTVPESIESLVAGRPRVDFVKLHTVGEPAPEEAWLRANARLVKNKELGAITISEYRPLEGNRF